MEFVSLNDKLSLRFHYLYNIYFSNFVSFIMNNHFYDINSILYKSLSYNYRSFMLEFLFRKKKKIVHDN